MRANPWVAAFVVGGVLQLACATPAAPTAAAPAEPALEMPVAPPPDEPLLDLVPDSAVGALLIRRSGLGLLARYLDSDPGLREDLGQTMLEGWGCNLTTAEGVVVFANDLSERPEVGAVIRLPEAPALKLPVAGATSAGVKIHAVEADLFAAAVPKGLVVGTRAAVESALAGPRGDGAARLPGLRHPGARAAVYAVSALAAGVPNPMVKLVAMQYGVDGVTVHAGRDGAVVATATGDPQRLTQLAELIRTQIAAGVDAAAAKRAQAMASGATGDKLALIAAHHQALALQRELAPRMVDGRLVIRYQPPNLTTDALTTVAIIGILAAIAIPAFSRYIKRSRAAQAQTLLGQVRGNAAAFAEGARGSVKTFKFPASTDWTPPGSCCAGADGQCPADAAAWSGATWKALHMTHHGPSRYQVRVTTSGKGKKPGGARITIEVRGDLDCDGVFASFRTEGAFDASGALGFTPPSVDNELE